jgi:hypothetical protein
MAPVKCQFAAIKMRILLNGDINQERSVENFI